MPGAEFIQNPNNSLDIVRPTKFKWVIIKNEFYDQMRTFPGYEGFVDMPEVN